MAPRAAGRRRPAGRRRRCIGVANAVAGGGSLLLFSALLTVGFPPIAMNVTHSVILIAILALAATRAGSIPLRLLSLIISVVVFAIGAPVDWLVAALLVPATLIRELLGAKLAGQLPAPVLRLTVVVVGLGVPIYLFVR